MISSLVMSDSSVAHASACRVHTRGNAKPRGHRASGISLDKSQCLAVAFHLYPCPIARFSRTQMDLAGGYVASGLTSARDFGCWRPVRADPMDRMKVGSRPEQTATLTMAEASAPVGSSSTASTPQIFFARSRLPIQTLSIGLRTFSNPELSTTHLFQYRQSGPAVATS